MSTAPQPTPAVRIRGLRKQYPDFLLDDISFEVPQGSIVGLIGENGAGKSTAINLLLNLVASDGGDISIYGRQWSRDDKAIKQLLGVAFDESVLPMQLTPQDVGAVFAPVYPQWDQNKYQQLLADFALPPQREIGKLSRGMRAKLAAAVALAHDAKLLVLDEATTGLDVGARDDMEEILLRFIGDGQRAVLFSTHLTEDLARIADYIVLLHQVRVLFQQEKDVLLEQWGILKVRQADAATIDQSLLLAERADRGIRQYLVADLEKVQRIYPDFTVDKPTLDDILLFYIKGESI